MREMWIEGGKPYKLYGAWLGPESGVDLFVAGSHINSVEVLQEITV